MTEFKHLRSFSPDGKENLTSIASGPVIIQDGRVLLDKHGDDGMWKFPGGAVESDNNFEENAIREAREELNIDVELVGEPYVISFIKESGEVMVLIHYAAKIVSGEPRSGRDVDEFDWFDINILPDGCAPNIKPAVEFFRNKLN